MKKLIIPLFCLLAAIVCNSQNRRISVKETVSTYNKQADTTPSEPNPVDTTGTPYEQEYKPAEDIRFAGWKLSDWADNEYIRTVRRYLDAYHNGDIANEELDNYKDYIKGKFVIGDIKPSLFGGAFMYILFYDNPEKVFSAMVNSSVDEETGEVYDYVFMGLKLEDFESGYTQEEILLFLELHPEFKLE